MHPLIYWYELVGSQVDTAVENSQKDSRLSQIARA
jgi:hypothetical protein